MKVLARITDKKGEMVKIVRYQSNFQDQVMVLFREGHPDSFDGVDLRTIKSFTKENDKTFLLAFCGKKLAGCLTGFRKVRGCHNSYMTGYRYVKEEFRHRRIATIIQGIAEEILKNKARLIVATNTGILPEDDQSIGWFKTVGFVELGEVKGWYRDDLPAVFLGKRNPHFPIGKGIPKNSGWDTSITDSLTGQRISKKDYSAILKNPGLAPMEKWGLNLLNKEDIIMINI